MFLKELSLTNYKNFESLKFSFDTKIICFVGLNGVGKTNILDSIYHLSYTKSYFNPIPSQNIKHGETFFFISGRYMIHDKEENILVSLKKGDKKIIKRNNKLYKKFSDHIGKIPLVLISPDDRNLIIEGSETRRKFIDGIISQTDKEYLNNLIDYNKTLKQRNALLKMFYDNSESIRKTIDIYDRQLSSDAQKIYDKRREFLNEFIPIFKSRYKELSNDKENVEIKHSSDISPDQNLYKLLKNSLEKDLRFQYTTKGIHKDDLNLSLDNFPIKKYGSQGQQKTFLIAMKLAQFDYLSKLDSKPILLLDDIFDKLDDSRVKQIINLVNQEKFNQIFISDTNKTRSENIIKKVNKSYKIFEI
ncbi:MAG: DNA replication and repair protein RecF [Flavobacteriaceae bacterium]|mgnify:FL=1|nr:DNA replication and repair protein RecF [Flavobacteriaceae bacterium]|tara:strand:- start:220 stop:1299 length:1080 start_codon:yes stop_codon:yes gene_type:complete